MVAVSGGLCARGESFQFALQDRDDVVAVAQFGSQLDELGVFGGQPVAQRSDDGATRCRTLRVSSREGGPAMSMSVV